MFLKKIKLKNYRNYKALDFSFKKNKTLLIGKNAQGKTNLLEAVYYLSSLNSSRIKKDSELVNFDEEFTNINGSVFKADTDIELDITINPPKNKILKVNGLKKAKSKDFLRVLSVVSFSVDDLLLLRGEPSDRRKWLDLAICQIYPAYADKLSKFNKIRLQKANYLSVYSTTGTINHDMLDVYNIQLSISSANIIYLRMKFLSELNKIAKDKHLSISKSEDLELKYESSVVDGILPLNELTVKISEKLQESKEQEIRRAQCLVGPHRDDVSYLINGLDAKKFASQGQQRTVVLALKLAELDIIKAKINELPVLLLDDVLAELDSVRQNYLLDTIEGSIQTIITSVDTLAFDDEFLKDVDIVKIKDGKIAI